MCVCVCVYNYFPGIRRTSGPGKFRPNPTEAY